METAVPIRSATPADAAVVAGIYRPYVESTAISFEAEPPEAEEMRKRMAVYQAKYPWLVFDTPGGVTGYAYGCPHRARTAYQWAAEVSIYLAPEAQGKGVAAALYKALLELLKRQGFTQALAGITQPNPASSAFHARMGFTEFATFRRVGWKFGQWHDTAWWRLDLAEPGAPPRPLRRPEELSAEEWAEGFTAGMKLFLS